MMLLSDAELSRSIRRVVAESRQRVEHEVSGDVQKIYKGRSLLNRYVNGESAPELGAATARRLRRPEQTRKCTTAPSLSSALFGGPPRASNPKGAAL